MTGLIRARIPKVALDVCEHLEGLLQDCGASVVIWPGFDVNNEGIPRDVIALQLYGLTEQRHPEWTPLVILPLFFCPTCGKEVKWSYVGK